MNVLELIQQRLREWEKARFINPEAKPDLCIKLPPAQLFECFHSYERFHEYIGRLVPCDDPLTPKEWMHLVTGNYRFHYLGQIWTITSDMSGN